MNLCRLLLLFFLSHFCFAGIGKNINVAFFPPTRTACCSSPSSFLPSGHPTVSMCSGGIPPKLIFSAEHVGKVSHASCFFYHHLSFFKKNCYENLIIARAFYTPSARLLFLPLLISFPLLHDPSCLGMMQKGITLTTLAASSAGAAGTGGMCTDRKGSQTSPEAGAVSLSAGAAGVSRGASPSASPPSSPSGGDADTDSAVTTASPSKSSVSGATTIAAKMGVAIARDSQRSESTATSALKRAAGADASVPTDARTSPVRSPSGTSAAAKAAIATAAAAAAAQKNTRAAAVAVAAAASSPPPLKIPHSLRRCCGPPREAEARQALESIGSSCRSSSCGSESCARVSGSSCRV